MTIDALIKNVEYDTIKILDASKKDGTMTEERAKEIAAYVVHGLKDKVTIEQLYEVVKDFDQHFPELKQVILNMSDEYDQIIKKLAIDEVHKLLQTEEFAGALSVIKKSIAKETDISHSIIQRPLQK